MISLSESVSYIRACEEPLSADIGVIFGEKNIWLYDAGSIPENAEHLIGLGKPLNCVLSHFHPDHTSALYAFQAENVYLSPYTHRYVQHERALEVTEDIYITDGVRLHIFPMPSTHSKGSLGLEAGNFAFLGDALYTAQKGGRRVFNSGTLLEGIKKLRSLNAEYFLLSHDEKFVYSAEEVIGGLERIYSLRKKNEPYIEINV